MHFALNIKPVSYPTLTPFTISRSSVNAVDVVQLSIKSGSHMGRGECRPYSRYNQSTHSVMADLMSVWRLIESGDIETALTQLESCSAARNALEAAWVDFQAKKSGRTAADILGVATPKKRQTAFTLSWGSVDEMATAALEAYEYPWLKIKIGRDGLKQVLVVAEARPDAHLIIDANEALDPASLPAFLDALSGLNIALIEQPLTAGHTASLPKTDLLICADEGLHNQADLPRLWAQGYRAVNVKLDKCGGPLAARDLILKSREMGFTVMAGCMVGSSLAMAPMMTLESLCDIIDLDGALLLSEDIQNGLRYESALVYPPAPTLWG